MQATTSFDGRSASFTSSQGAPTPSMMYGQPPQQMPFASGYRSISDLGVNGHPQSSSMNSSPQIYTVSSSLRDRTVGPKWPNWTKTDKLPVGARQAVYSGVSVYEMEINGVAVMRRRSDSWLNATQILKVAGVDKGKRTKVLEKEILTGEHEKVQGGYGK